MPINGDPKTDEYEDLLYDTLLDAIREVDSIGTGSVETHGATYRWARFRGKRLPDAPDAIAWCREQLGPENNTASDTTELPRWFEVGGKLYFRDNPDFVLFMVRWG